MSKVTAQWTSLEFGGNTRGDIVLQHQHDDVDVFTELSSLLHHHLLLRQVNLLLPRPIVLLLSSFSSSSSPPFSLSFFSSSRVSRGCRHSVAQHHRMCHREIVKILEYECNLL